MIISCRLLFQYYEWQVVSNVFGEVLLNIKKIKSDSAVRKHYIFNVCSQNPE